MSNLVINLILFSFFTAMMCNQGFHLYYYIPATIFAFLMGTNPVLMALINKVKKGMGEGD